MKKFKIIFATIMLGIATVGGFQAYENANMTGAKTLLLENVEALAELESGHYFVECYNRYDKDGSWHDELVTFVDCNSDDCDDVSYYNPEGLRYCIKYVGD